MNQHNDFRLYEPDVFRMACRPFDLAAGAINLSAEIHARANTRASGRKRFKP